MARENTVLDDFNTPGPIDAPTLAFTSMTFWFMGNLSQKLFDPHTWAVINGPLATISFLVSISAGVFAVYTQIKKVWKKRGGDR